MPSLGGTWINSPTANPDYQRSLYGIGQNYPGRNLSSSTAGRPTSEYVPQAPQAAPQAASPAPSLTPPIFDMSLLQQLFNSSTPSEAPSYSSGISVGPVWDPGTTTNASQSMRHMGQQGLGFGQIAGVKMSGAQMGQLNAQAGRSGGGQTARMATGFSRDAAQANQRQRFAGEQARANEGVSLANMVAQIQGQQQQQQRQRGQFNQSLISSLMGMV